MSKLAGLAVVAGIVPAAYATAAFIVVSTGGTGRVPSDFAARVAVLMALPLVVMGVVKWWDLWVKPFPKMGAGWSPVPPNEYLKTVAWGQGKLFAAVAILSLMLGILSPPPDAETAKAERERLEQLTQEEPGLKKQREDLEAQRFSFRTYDPQADAKRKDWEAKCEEVDRRLAAVLKEKGQLAGKVSHDQNRNLFPLWLLIFAAVRTAFALPSKAYGYSGKPITTGG